jgi:hypothetical protein
VAPTGARKAVPRCKQHGLRPPRPATRRAPRLPRPRRASAFPDADLWGVVRAKHRGTPFGQLPDVRQIPALSRQPLKVGPLTALPAATGSDFICLRTRAAAARRRSFRGRSHGFVIVALPGRHRRHQRPVPRNRAFRQPPQPLPIAPARQNSSSGAPVASHLTGNEKNSVPIIAPMTTAMQTT